MGAFKLNELDDDDRTRPPIRYPTSWKVLIHDMVDKSFPISDVHVRVFGRIYRNRKTLYPTLAPKVPSVSEGESEESPTYTRVTTSPHPALNYGPDSVSLTGLLSPQFVDVVLSR